MFSALRNTLKNRNNKRTRNNSVSSRGARKHHKRADGQKAQKELARVFSSLSLHQSRARSPSLEKQQKFKARLAKMLRAHNNDWAKLPMFAFIDIYVSDEGETIGNRLRHVPRV